VEVVPLRFARSALDRAPEDERMLFLLAGHFSNDVYILQKQLIFSVNGLGDGEFDNRWGMAISVLNARLLVGRLVAAWELIGREKYRAILDQSLEALTNTADDVEYAAAGIAALPVLDALLGGGSLLAKIRNKTAAHTDRKVLADAYAKLPEDYQFLDLLSAGRGNSLYGAADEVAVRALLDFSNEDDPKVALEEVADAATGASAALGDVLNAWFLYFSLNYLRKEFDEALESRVEIENAPSIDEVMLPFLTREGA
jgi:hypothetical protein